MTPTSGDAELPPAETCGMDDDDDEDEDEQFDTVEFSENKSKKFFNKINLIENGNNNWNV